MFLWWKKYKIRRDLRKKFSTTKRQVVEYVELARLLKEAKRFPDALKSLQLAIELLDCMMKYQTTSAATKAILKRKNISLIIEANFLAQKIDRHNQKKKEQDLQFFIHDLDRDYMNSVPTVVTDISPLEKMKKEILELSLQKGQLSNKAVKCIDEMIIGNINLTYKYYFSFSEL